MSTSKRIISLLLALVMVLGMLPWDALGVEAAGFVETVRLSIESAKSSKTALSAVSENISDQTETAASGTTTEVTRAQWIQMLVDTFSMVVEEDNYPDNYFSDLTGDEEYYRDILVAVEFGVIDLEAGLPFEAEAAATREFCAHTLNFCLGYQLGGDSAYTFAEMETVMYPDDIQIAINRGWFALESGAFLPEQPVTAQEMDKMMQDAAAVLASDVIDPDYQNSYEFADEVIELSEQTAVYWESDDEISLFNPDQEIKNGDIFAVYEDGFPLVCRAEKVTKTGSLHTITITSLNINDYLVSVDAQGTSVTDLADFEPAEDVEAIYILDDGSEVYSVQDAGTREIKSICLAKEFKGYKVHIEVYDMVLNWHSEGGLFNDLDTSAVVTGRAYFNVSVPFGASVSDFSDVLTLGTVPIGPFGRISVTAELSIDGSVSFDYGTKFSVGVSYNGRDRFRIPMTFEKTRFSMCVEANVKAGISVSAGLTGIPMLSATCRATVGLQVNFTARYRGEDSTPKLCIHTDAWLYCSAYASATVGIKKFDSTSKTWSGSIVIWDRNHSPVRSSSHFEDGTYVSKCTRGDFGSVRYYSSGSSRYANGGVSAVSNSPTYTYTTDDDGNATITGFTGNASSISIPLTIDGHPVTAIGKNAFSRKTSLYSVTLPSGVVSIGENAFKGCTGLRDVRLPDTLTEIGDYAFQNCSSLTTVAIPSGVVKISTSMFSGCKSLQWIILPDSVTAIGSNAFADTGLTSLKLPSGLDYMGDYILKGNTGVKELTIPKTITTMDSIGYGSLSLSSIEKVVFEEGITAIPAYATKGASKLTEVVIPDSVTTIGLQAFSNTALTNLKLPPYLISMGDDILRGNNGVKELTIPNSVTTMESITHGSLNESSVEKLIFEEGRVKIPAYAAKGASKITEVIIPESVTTIGNSAFSRTGFIDFTIPSHIVSVGNNLFSGCAALKSVTWSEKLTSIPDGTFSGATALDTIVLPNNLLSIDKDAFENCDSLVTIDIPASVTTISAGAFSECDMLESIELPIALQKINSSTFYNCDSLTSIVIPYGITSIGSSAFYDCDALETVDMANSVTSLGSSAFKHCDVLKNVKLSRNLATIPSEAFRECAGLEEIVIPYFATKIEANAFNSSPKLTKVVVHEKLASINTSAFSYADRTVFYGPTGSYTNTWCTDNGYSFVENTAATTKVTAAENSVTIPKGKTYMLDFDIDPIDFHEVITTKSSNTAVATVDETGKITAVAPGTATIKIIVGGASASCKVTVTQAVTKITLNKTKLSLDVPQTYQLTAAITPSDASNKTLNWTSSNPAAATVDANGLVTAVGNGTAVIKAESTDGTGISASCTVTVIDPSKIPVSGIALDKNTLSLEAMEDYQLTATVSPANAANKGLVWSSSNEAVATVDSNGKVTAVAKGTVTITAAAADGYGASASCTVTVTNNGYLVTDLAQFQSSHPYADRCTDFWIYRRSGAGSLSITFAAETEIEDGFDYLYIYDGEGNLIGKYTGTELANQTITIPGDTVKVQIESDDSGNAWGFQVVDVEYTDHNHSFTNYISDGNATCTEDGTKTAKCDHCDLTDTIPDVGSALGHAWGNWIVIQEPTTTENGVEEHTCTRCGHTEQRSIAKLENPFNDVAPGSFFYEPVMWAIENGITNGTSATTFGPNDQCMRAHVVTFLWRAVGSPEPTRTDNPFVDVKPTDFYYKPVLWALENGITSGMDATHFGPTAYCNRAQVVTFLYRTMGNPDVGAATNPFTDVAAGSFYEKPVLWAVENGVTAGLSATSFGPNSICNRAQIVTFLYRAFVH